MMPLRIMTRDFNLLDEVDRYASLQITRKWHGIGEINLVINRYLKGADKLNRGKQKLSEHEQEIYLEGQILTKSQLVYQRDYDLGDIVTLQEKGWGVTMDARITAVTEIYEQGGFKLDLTFDNDRPTLIDKIKQEIGSINQELTR